MYKEPFTVTASRECLVASDKLLKGLDMSKRQELIRRGKEYKALPMQGNGKAKYPMEFKKEVLKAIEDGVFDSQVDFTNEIGLSETALVSWKRQVKGVITSRTVSHGKGKRHAISTKIEASEMVLHNGNSISQVANKLGVTWESVSNWVKDYQEGLYTLESVVQVSRKKFKSSDVLLGELTNIEASIRDKKKEIKDALKREYEEKLSRIA